MAKRWDRLSVNNRLVVFLTVTFSYLAKFVLYRYEVSLDKELIGWQTIGAYVLLTGASMLFATIGLRKNRLWLALIPMVLLDLWMMANILYFQSNFMLLEWPVILLAGNLHGFEDSILSYLSWQLFLFPLITSSVAVFWWFSKQEIEATPISNKHYLIVFAVILSVYMTGLGLARFGSYQMAQRYPDKWTFDGERKTFIRVHTPAAHLGWVAWDGVCERFLHIKAVLPLTDEEQALIRTIYTDSVAPARPQGHLVCLLVESWEAWTLSVRDEDGKEVCEHLNRYIRNHNLLLCTNVLTQQKYGRSGDGQLITQTGLLPLSTGVTCMSYGDNVYPNIAHFYPQSVLLNPYPGVWNQRVTTYAYGFQKLREPERFRKGTDSLMIDWTIRELQQAQAPEYVLTLTINTHAPFTDVPATLRFGTDYTRQEALYLQTVHYMDRQIGRFLAWADTAAVMNNATIVITADHNHFECTQGKGTCPLLIQSPSIDRTIPIPQAYQMDIFPTVLHAIGQSDYAWHGFGVDWLSPNPHRAITPQQAYTLSDKMLRTNFFAR